MDEIIKIGEEFFKILRKEWDVLLVLIIIGLAWNFNLLKELLFIFGVAILGRIAWALWVHYIQQDFISGIDFVMLEIVPPREVLRSPKAMELFITNALYHMSDKGGKRSVLARCGMVLVFFRDCFYRRTSAFLYSHSDPYTQFD